MSNRTEYHRRWYLKNKDRIDAQRRAYNKHRKLLGVGARFILWVIRNNFPNSLRILCHNCNHSMGAYGYCPHQKIIPSLLEGDIHV